MFECFPTYYMHSLYLGIARRMLLLCVLQKIEPKLAGYELIWTADSVIFDEFVTFRANFLLTISGGHMVIAFVRSCFSL